MKILLFIVSIFMSSFIAWANETRSETFSRYGQPVPWGSQAQKFPEVVTGLSPEGRLHLAHIGLIESLHPYEFKFGRIVQRPQQIDDLLFESLFLRDPINDSEALYPLIARALRYSDDFTNVLFELDPAAEFQDGHRVTPEDVLFSYQVFLRDHPMHALHFNEAVESVRRAGHGVRFAFKVKGQTARDLIMQIAQIKIVKAHLQNQSHLAGVDVAYMGTGPYRLDRASRTVVALVKNHYYWGSNLPVRNGFFNFQGIEIHAFPDENAVRAALSSGRLHIFEEKNPSYVDHTLSQIRQKGLPIGMQAEPYKGNGAPLAELLLNVESLFLQKMKIRQAVILAFPFEQINGLYFGSRLTRPRSLLHQSAMEPKGIPSPEAKAAFAKCGSEVPENIEQDFESYAQMGLAKSSHRQRLLVAQSLLFQAGYKNVNGRLVSTTDPKIKANLRILVHHDLHRRMLYLYKQDLERLGISVQIVLEPQLKIFQQKARSGKYDLIQGTSLFLTKDDWPRVALIAPTLHSSFISDKESEMTNLNRLRSSCMDQLLDSMNSLPPLSREYKGHAEAIARLQQALALNIFTGEPKQLHFLMDERVHVPTKLFRQRAHLYGYWINQPLPVERPSFWPFPDHCLDLNCLFR